MSPSRLSTELWLQIAEELIKCEDASDGLDRRANNNKEEEEEDEEGDDDDKKRQESESASIPHVLLAWSSVSPYFRHLLSPHIFKTIVLRNTTKSGKSILTVADNRNLAHLIQSLNFIGTAPGTAHSKDPAYSDVKLILPGPTKAVLTNLHRFPNLSGLRIKFDYDFADLDEWEDGMHTLRDGESERDVVEAEESQAWRALMAQVYNAVGEDAPAHVKHLHLNDVVCREVSSFRHKGDFHALLGSLDSFTIGWRGFDDGTGRHINVLEPYTAFATDLGSFFWRHLKHVTTLTVKAPREGPLGLQGENHAPLAFGAEDMPRLRNLRLENCFAGPELVVLCVGHVASLETVVLKECFACPPSSFQGLAQDGMTWAESFGAIVAAGSRRLVRFELEGQAPLTWGESYGRKSAVKFGMEGEEEDEDIVAAREILGKEGGGGKRRFPHATLDDKYGYLRMNVDENVRSILGREDQRGWDLLMRLVEGNRKRIGEEMARR